MNGLREFLERNIPSCPHCGEKMWIVHLVDPMHITDRVEVKCGCGFIVHTFIDPWDNGASILNRLLEQIQNSTYGYLSRQKVKAKTFHKKHRNLMQKRRI